MQKTQFSAQGCQYGLRISYFMGILVIFIKNCFSPKPKINSTVLSFRPKKNNFNIKNPKNLETVTRILFSNRRKMINKNFSKLFKNNKSVAINLNLNLRLRPEELNSEMYYKIAMTYEKLLN